MGESRLIVEELLALCLQRITMEESTINAELGKTPWGRPGVALRSSDAQRSYCCEVLQPLADVCAVPAEMIEVVKNFETVRKQWLHAETELKKYKELLVKSDVAKAALEVKLKHARNQLDVEMKKRYKIEGDYQYLVSKGRLSLAGQQQTLTSAPVWTLSKGRCS